MYSTKEVMNLMANSFSARSVMIAFLSQLSLTANLSRIAKVESVILRTSNDKPAFLSPAVDTVVVRDSDKIEAERIVREEVLPKKGNHTLVS